MTPTTITCGDLALLGGPWDPLARHDPRQMDVEHDALCHCHGGPHRERVVRCEAAFPVPLGPDYELLLCCLCESYVADVLRAAPRPRYSWMLQQAREAVEYRDRRRLDSSPCVADMDVEAEAVDPPEPWEPRYHPIPAGCCRHGALIMSRCSDCEAGS